MEDPFLHTEQVVEDGQSRGDFSSGHEARGQGGAHQDSRARWVLRIETALRLREGSRYRTPGGFPRRCVGQERARGETRRPRGSAPRMRRYRRRRVARARVRRSTRGESSRSMPSAPPRAPGAAGPSRERDAPRSRTRAREGPERLENIPSRPGALRGRARSARGRDASPRGRASPAIARTDPATGRAERRSRARGGIARRGPIAASS